MNKPPALIRRDWLDVGDGHQLHLAQYGNPEGIPVLYLHGGPGAGCIAEDLALFDGGTYHLLMLDQRGAGRSRPIGQLQQNNLLVLLKDLEKVRVWLSIPAWCLVGGSFGATLGIIYSGLYPKRVLSQVYWGLFIPSEDGINWLYSNRGAANLFASEYLAFTSLAPFSVHTDKLFEQYRVGMQHSDCDIRSQFIHQWIAWELALSTPAADIEDVDLSTTSSLAEIELHFASHQYFGAYALMRQLTAEVQAQTIILQGEMDWVCPTQLVENFLNEFGSDAISYSMIKCGYHGLANDKMARDVIYAVREMANNMKEE